MFDDMMDEEQELAQIRGTKKRPDMGLLNQKNVSEWEMDELFSDEDDEYLEEF